MKKNCHHFYLKKFAYWDMSKIDPMYKELLDEIPNSQLSLASLGGKASGINSLIRKDSPNKKEINALANSWILKHPYTIGRLANIFGLGAGTRIGKRRTDRLMKLFEQEKKLNDTGVDDIDFNTGTEFSQMENIVKLPFLRPGDKEMMELIYQGLIDPNEISSFTFFSDEKPPKGFVKEHSKSK